MPRYRLVRTRYVVPYIGRTVNTTGLKRKVWTSRTFKERTRAEAFIDDCVRLGIETKAIHKVMDYEEVP